MTIKQVKPRRLYGLIKIPFGLEIQYHFTLMLNTPRDNYTVMSQLCQMIKHRKWIDGKKPPPLWLRLSPNNYGKKDIHNLRKRILFGSLIPWELQVAAGKDISISTFHITRETISPGSSNNFQQDQLLPKTIAYSERCRICDFWRRRFSFGTWDQAWSKKRFCVAEFY